MTVIVNSGSTLVVPSTGLTLTADSTIAAGGVLDDSNGGTITGGFDLVNDGIISLAHTGTLTIDTAGFVNQGTISSAAGNGPLTIGSSVALANLVDGTLTGGTWTIFGGFQLLDGTISTLDADLEDWNYGHSVDVEAGPGGTGTQAIVNTLTEIGTGGILTLVGQLAAPGILNVDGELSLQIQADAAAAEGVTISSTGILTAGSFDQVTIASPLTLNGTLELGTQTDLTLEGNVSGTGTIINDGGTLVFPSSGTFAPNVTLQGSGVVADISPALAPVHETIAEPSNVFGSFLIENQPNVSTIATLELADATDASVTFNGAPTGPDHGVLILDQPAGFTGTIVGFNNDSTIILKGVVGDVANLVTNPFTGTTLSVLNGTTPLFGVSLESNSYSEQIYLGHSQYQFEQFSQQFGQAVATATPDLADDETIITVSGVQDFESCFRAGTRIGTPAGLVAVERLSPGDLVISHFGAERPVVWIGHREVDCARHPDPRSVWPVRIAPNAFGPGQPHSALFLSPDHAVFVDGVLIPVRLLINGTTIRPIEASRVTWYHVELEEHDALFAEGLAVESYFDQDNRAFFTNGEAPVRLIPNFTVRTWEMAGCAPLVVTGARLARVRAMLEARAGDGILAERTPCPPAEVA